MIKILLQQLRGGCGGSGSGQLDGRSGCSRVDARVLKICISKYQLDPMKLIT